MSAKSASKAFLAILSILIAPQACAAGSPQTWHLTDYEPTGSAGIRSMNATIPPMEGEGGVALTTGGRIWIADFPASSGIDMSGEWRPEIAVAYSADGSGARTVTVQIGKWNESAGFSRCSGTGTTLQLLPGETRIYSSAMQTTGHEIRSGEYLALRIYLNSSAGGYVSILCSNSTGDASPSSISSPALDDGYPAAELPTFALFIAGLSVLILRRRR